LRSEGIRVFELGGDGAVQGDCDGEAGRGAFGFGVGPYEVVGSPVDPTGIAVGQAVLHDCSGQSEIPHEVPAGQCEYTGLERVVESKEQMQLFDLLNVGAPQLGDVFDTECGGDDRGGCAGDAVAELEVVGSVLADEPVVHFPVDDVAKLLACYLRAV